MTELDEVAEAIYVKHIGLWPLSHGMAESLAWEQLQGQGEPSIELVRYKLLAFNDRDRTPKPINWEAEPVLAAKPKNPQVTYIPKGVLTDLVDTTKRKYYIDQKRYYSRTWLPGMLPIPADGRWTEVESAVYDDFQKMVKLASPALLKKARQ